LPSLLLASWLGWQSQIQASREQQINVNQETCKSHSLAENTGTNQAKQATSVSQKIFFCFLFLTKENWSWQPRTSSQFI